ncbi:MAG: VPLPA-CTERM sorting domain-containing protein [Gammaproteobacteria bacterium]|nr:VPLPA-CTERM sorting domain-containing protein [Gammaproteobacteria bacterium]
MQYHYEGQLLAPLPPDSPPYLVAAMPAAVTNITATFTIANAVSPGVPGAYYQPLSFTLSDGATTFVNSAPPDYYYIFWLQADSLGSIESWSVFIEDVEFGGDAVGRLKRMYTQGELGFSYEDTTQYCANVETQYTGACLATPSRNAFNRPGVWSVSPVPVPAAAWLFGSALGLIGVMRRKVSG